PGRVGVFGLDGLFGLSGLIAEGSGGDVGGIEELGAVFVGDEKKEHAVGDAGDEVTYIMRLAETRHGLPVGHFGAVVGFVVAGALAALEVVGLLVGFPAVFDGGAEGGSQEGGHGRSFQE